MATRRLQAHPQTPCGVIDEVVVDIDTAADGGLVARYAIIGDLDRLRIPAPGAGLGADRLWAHTCCELFVAPASGEDYIEWNFSPSGQIARFAFSTYRRRLASAPTELGDSVVTRQGRELRLEARVHPPQPPPLRISLTAVIEDLGGTLSYWALHHPCERPDFHDLGGFAFSLTLDRPTAIVDP